MICIIGSETTKSYGLFDDLSQLPDYRIVYTKPPFLYGTFLRKTVWRIRWHILRIKEVHMAWEKSIIYNLNLLDRIVVIDTALRWLELSFLNKCRELKPGLIIDLFFLNSTESWTFHEPVLKSKYKAFQWSSIMTFDPHDAEKNNWTCLGMHYYSKHKLSTSRKMDTDLFFAGSISGQRGERLLHLLQCFNANDVKCKYICPSLGWRHYLSKQPKGMRLIWKRIPYKRILKKMLGSNCILEVLQEGQGASSLRYLEAVCYNKKLLTTNPEITKYPFYDERYMKVFSTEADIDYDWVKKVEPIDYGYNNEFSPSGLFQNLASVRRDHTSYDRH